MVKVTKAWRYCKSKTTYGQAILQKLINENERHGEIRIVWTDESDKPFEKCKRDMAGAATLTKKAASWCSTSFTRSGSSIDQVVHKESETHGYFSSRLTETKTYYSVYDRILLTIYLAQKHCQQLIEGSQPFSMVKALIYAFNKRNDKESPQQIRQLDYIFFFVSLQRTSITYPVQHHNINQLHWYGQRTKIQFEHSNFY